MLISLLTGDSISVTNVIMYLISALLVIFLVLPIHEFAHGFVATKLGDYTPRMQGRLTLNPMAHIDYMGALCTLLFGFGWAKPVQVNARNFKNPKMGMALTALAGPMSNIICAFIAVILWYTVWLLSSTFGSVTLVILSFLNFLIRMNVYLAVFNLIPLPPFDGSRILFSFLSTKYYFLIMKYERYIYIGLMVLLFSGILDKPLNIAANSVIMLLDNIVGSVFGLFI